MKQFMIFTLSFLIFLSSLYGIYWVVKTVSYSIFYEDMVIETINQKVKSSCLKEPK